MRADFYAEAKPDSVETPAYLQKIAQIKNQKTNPFTDLYIFWLVDESSAAENPLTPTWYAAEYSCSRRA